MNEPEYESDFRVSLERIAASVIVVCLIACAYLMGGHGLAIRAILTFMIPLAMIWLPDIFVRIATLDAKWERQFSAPASQIAIRMIAWAVIIGVPASWFIFSSIRG